MVLQLRDTLSGVCGAVCCTYAGLPFDVAKVRLQSQAQRGAAVLTSPSLRYTGLADCFTKMLREEGLCSLFRGAVPALSSAISENAMGITVQHAVHRQLGRFYGDPQMRFSCPMECLIGAFTGFFTSVAMCPFEVAKVKLQATRALQTTGTFGRTPTTSLSPLECMRSIAQTQGVRGLYCGLGGLWARDIPFNAIFFGTYESTCTVMLMLGNHKSKDQLHGAQVFFAGGLAGAVGWSLVMPFDVVKTRLQAGRAQGSVLAIMQSIVTHEGASGLFRGWGAAVIRAVPANAGLFMGVELSTRWLHEVLD